MGGAFESAEDFSLKLIWLPSLPSFCAGSEDTESEWELNAPNKSDPSKLLSGTAAKGSKMLASAGAEFGAFASGCTTGSGMAKRSTVEEAEEEMAGWEANRSTLVCTNGTNKSLLLQKKKVFST